MKHLSQGPSGELMGSYRLFTPDAGGTTVLLIDSSLCLIRKVPHPGHSRAQRAASALSLLGPDLASPASSCRIALSSPDDEEGWVAIIDTSGLLEAVQPALVSGLRFDAVVPDVFMLPEPKGEEAVIARLNGRVLVRTHDLMFSAENDIAELLIGERLASETDFSSALATRQATPGLQGLPCFATGRSAERTSSGMRSPLLALAAGAACFALAPWIASLRLDLRAAEAEREIAGIASEALGQDGPVRLPLAQMREAGLAFSGGEEASRISGHILQSAGLEASLNPIELRAESGQVSFRFSGVEPAGAERIIDRLVADGLTAELTQSPGAAGAPVFLLVVRGGFS